MKKTILLLSVVFLSLSLASCSGDEDENDPAVGETKEGYIDATSKTAWNYYSLSEAKLVGTADESAENNATWAARKDWDIAVQRYNVRTNSGEFTTANAQGGVYTLAEGVSFASVTTIPAADKFVTDKAITSEGMGGTTTVVRSEAVVFVFKKNENGESIMPPVYLKPPVYIFRTADGNSYYKVLFTQYKNDSDVTGHVKFDIAKINQ